MEFKGEFNVEIDSNYLFYREFITAQTGICAIQVGDRARNEKEIMTSVVISVVNFEMQFDACLLVKALFSYREPEKMKIRFYPVLRDESFSARSFNNLDKNPFQRLFSNFMAQSFVCFYEKIKSMIQGRYGSNKKDWPDTLRFAWQMRNAFAHDGKLNITLPNTQIEWRSLIFNQNDNGDQILYNRLTTGDIFILMLDVDQHLRDQR